MLKVSKPSFYFGYYRPWDKNTNLYESWLDYNRDNQRSDYVSKMIVNGIKGVNAENINHLKDINSTLGNGFQTLQSELQSIDDSLTIINSTLDEGFYDLKQNQIKQIQLTVATNIILSDIKTLISFSDSEKERLESIREGLKFIANVQRDEDYYEDAFRCFNKAVELKPSDYFSLFFLGYILTFSRNHIDPIRAIDFFKKSLKYSLIDDNNDIKLLNDFYTKVENNLSGIDLIDSSYLLISQCQYLIGDFENALNYSLKISEKSFLKNFTYQLKYASRFDDKNQITRITEKIFDNNIDNYEDVFTEIDVVNNVFTLNYFKYKINGIKNSFINLKNKYENYDENFEIIFDIKKVLPTANSIIEKKKLNDSYTDSKIDSEISKQIEFEKFAEDTVSRIENLYTDYTNSRNEFRAKLNEVSDKKERLKKFELEDYWVKILVTYIILCVLSLVYIFISTDGAAKIIANIIMTIIAEVVLFFILNFLSLLILSIIQKIFDSKIDSTLKVEKNLSSSADSIKTNLAKTIKSEKDNFLYFFNNHKNYQYSKKYLDRINKIQV